MLKCFTKDVPARSPGRAARRAVPSLNLSQRASSLLKNDRTPFPLPGLEHWQRASLDLAHDRRASTAAATRSRLGQAGRVTAPRPCAHTKASVWAMCAATTRQALLPLDVTRQPGPSTREDGRGGGGTEPRSAPVERLLTGAIEDHLLSGPSGLLARGFLFNPASRRRARCCVTRTQPGDRPMMRATSATSRPPITRRQDDPGLRFGESRHQLVDSPLGRQPLGQIVARIGCDLAASQLFARRERP